MFRFFVAALCASMLVPGTVTASCPYASMPHNIPDITNRGFNPHAAETFVQAIKDIDFSAVKEDIAAMLTDSQDFWPADWQDLSEGGHYGPFMIRQAWHCTGSYRKFDGRGGCDGARQRFDPERSWDDNTNLDKAKRLLAPIKEKYGVGLSWGDLIVLTGTTAIEVMGGPVLGFCAGRIDDTDGSWSEILGPTDIQEELAPCAVQGECEKPFGTTNIGLIYVDPHGPMGVADPAGSAPQVRDTFSRMGMNDAETVALIGGGHAFGKTHGACPDGPGPSPQEDPSNPWPGECSNGAYTSGFEGQWTTKPTTWTNYYFTGLQENEWELTNSTGLAHQWTPVDGPANVAMLNPDLSLLHDPENSYQTYVELFAKNMTALNDTFAHAWYKLMTRDMGPVSRCLGSLTPPAQEFQNPLPEPVADLADFDAVKADIQNTMKATDDSKKILEPDAGDSYASVFSYLAWQSASTFRVSDYQGGANGARIRFSPQANWTSNVRMDAVLKLLEPIKDKYGDGLSWADLIVLAGGTAIEASGGDSISFCSGRTDASDGQGSSYLPSGLGLFSATNLELREHFLLLGLSPRQYVALAARPRSTEQMQALGYSGSWQNVNSATLSTDYFKVLLSEDNTWEKQQSSNGNMTEYVAKGSDPKIYMTPSDMQIKWQADLLNIAYDFLGGDEGEKWFQSEFAKAWTSVMNADRFDGPLHNLCYTSSSDDKDEVSSNTVETIIITAACTMLVIGFLVYLLGFRRPEQSKIVQLNRTPLMAGENQA